MSGRKVIVLLVVFLLYLILGGGVFHLLEAPEEGRLREELFALQNTLGGNVSEETMLGLCGNSTKYTNVGPTVSSDGSSDLCCVPQKNIQLILANIEASILGKLANLSANNNTCFPLEHVPVVALSLQEINTIVDVVSLAIDRGLDPRSTPEEASPPRWSFSGACEFSVTVLTTIGYGSMAPSTPGGRAFCVGYGLFGIPLTAVLLAKVAHGLGSVAVRLTNKINRTRPSWNVDAVSRIVTAALVFLGLIIFVLLPALTVSIIEGWVYLDALYFMFVSLSTVGFGDYLIGQRRDVDYSIIYSLLIVLWILLGLAFLALVFDVISRSIEKVGEDKVEDQETEAESPSECADGEKKAGRNGHVGTVSRRVENVDNQTTAL